MRMIKKGKENDKDRTLFFDGINHEYLQGMFVLRSVCLREG